MSSYLTYYVVLGIVFVLGIIGYWVITRVLRDPSKIYLPDSAA